MELEKYYMLETIIIYAMNSHGMAHLVWNITHIRWTVDCAWKPSSKLLNRVKVLVF